MAGTHAESDNDHARQMFVDFDNELLYWRDHYRDCRFYRPGMDFDDYEPAVKLGINVFLRSHGRSFDELREQLEDSYQRTRGSSPLEWSEASSAAAAAWDRMSDRLQARISRHSNRDPINLSPTTARPKRTTTPSMPSMPPPKMAARPPTPASP